MLQRKMTRYLQPNLDTRGLICRLKLYEGTAFDYSLNGNDGTLTGTTLTYTWPGLDLAGVNEHIVVDDDAAFTPALTPLTISAWVNMDDATSFEIASKGVLGADGEWRFSGSATDKLTFIAIDENQVLCWIGKSYSVALSQNVWLNVAATYSGGTTSASAKLYLNGVQVDDGNAENNQGNFVTIQNDTGDVHIGRHDAAYANGQVDDVMIFTAEKTAAQIKSIYEVTRGRYSV